MRFARGIELLGGAALAVAAYLLWVRPWALHWGATEDEVKMHLPEDGLVERANFEATRAVTIEAPPETVWPWLVQIGRGRAGWYSYDRLDNEGVPSAREILPEYQHMEVGDTVVMSETGGQPQGPTVLALERPHMMLWGDPDEPHDFTWLWLLNRGDGERTRIVTRVRCRFSLRRPMAGMPGWLFMLMMELADPIMMRKQLLNLKSRVEAAKVGELLEPALFASSKKGDRAAN